MALNYASQQEGVALAATALQTSYADAVSFTVYVGKMTQAVIYVSYTTGAAETNNSIETKIETGNAATNLYRMTVISVSSGTVTLNNAEYTYTGASAATTYKFAIPIELSDQFLKVSFKETGVAANPGTVASRILISGK